MNIPHSSAPHGTEEVVIQGNQTNPTKALILIHGRGASAESILSITKHISLPEDVLVLVPQASGHTWYPTRFIAAQADNQPDLGSALDRIDSLISFLKETHDLKTNQIAIAGFSQGACLTLEFIKRNPAKYLAGIAWSGGLIGNDDEVITSIEGSLQETPIYLGCDEQDFHIPEDRVRTSAEYFRNHSADVTERLYTDIGHTIHPEGIEFLERVLNT